MTDKKTPEQVEAPEVFTKEQVEEMMQQQRDELKTNAITTLQEKNADLREQRLLAGQDEFYNIERWEVMRKMADDMVKSGALPKNDNAYTVTMKMQAGREMGLKPIESIKTFYIVNGVLSIFGDAVIRRLREHGWKLLPYEEKQDECIATIQKGDETYREKFTFDDATKSGWTKSSTGALKPGWIDGINRRRKLRYGAISTLIKTYVPEVMGAASDIAEVAEDTVPLYERKKGEPIALEDGNDEATEAQRDSVRTLIGYDKMDAEDKDYSDEWINKMNKQQAAIKIRELAGSAKKGKNE